MVLAHNEERHIAACLASLFDGEPGHPLDVYVMANGCTDQTEAVVREQAKKYQRVHLISIALGDKCNAWNVFVNEIAPKQAPDREIYFFMDGDARILPGSLSALSRGLDRNPRAHAASAPPASGRSIELDRRTLIQHRGLVANLYALRGSFMNELHLKSVRIPLGLEGDDGLIGALVKWDLDPATNRFDHLLIEPCEDAGFVFESMSPLKPSHWLSYWRRAVRYGRRRYEFQLLGNRLRKLGLEGLPKHISEIYGDSNSLSLQWNGIHTLPNWVALRNMRKVAASMRG
jgi:glycosyltransferase involved in cell wall biosynthesis